MSGWNFLLHIKIVPSLLERTISFVFYITYIRNPKIYYNLCNYTTSKDICIINLNYRYAILSIIIAGNISYKLYI